MSEDPDQAGKVGPEMSEWTSGNAAEDGAPYRGWFMGAFVADEVLSGAGVEAKWGVHEAGEMRASWTDSETYSTLVVMVSGRFSVHFPGGSVTFTQPGDYVMSPPGLTHSWEAHERSTILSVRWHGG